jgi:hypothetical protein
MAGWLAVRELYAQAKHDLILLYTTCTPTLHQHLRQLYLNSTLRHREKFATGSRDF